MAIQVTPPPSPPRGAHWVNEKPSSVRNTWPSWRTTNIFTTAKMGLDPATQTPIGKPELGPPRSLFPVALAQCVDLKDSPLHRVPYMIFRTLTRLSSRMITMTILTRQQSQHCTIVRIGLISSLLLETVITSRGSSLDWWQSSILRGDDFEFELYTRSAHVWPFRPYKTLWCSWVISARNRNSSATVFFAGDTAYRSVHPGEDEDSMPTCPPFREIGERFKEIDLALLPIGAYEPSLHLTFWVELFSALAMGAYYDEIETEYMAWEQLADYEDIATCPSCSLVVRVIYDPLDYEDCEMEGDAGEDSDDEASASCSLDEFEHTMEQLLVSDDATKVETNNASN
ncbi:hypothetical protein BDZ89DRAFT_1158164 [Hymenopellis radicata]|nr:hypothetical protein BDZ89DRAFT_1158164 [Hymenopellis radicata]